jgi:ketosteroid isomerase-like protein
VDQPPYLGTWILTCGSGNEQDAILFPSIRVLIRIPFACTLKLKMRNVKRRIAHWLLGIGFAISSYAPNLKAQNPMPEDFIRKYEAALATQKWEAVEPLMHLNCTVTFSDGSQHRGRKEVEKAFRKNFALIQDEKYAISKWHWIHKTEFFAVFTYLFDWSGVIDGKPVAGSGRGTSSLIQEGGVWLLVSENLGPRLGE